MSMLGPWNSRKWQPGLLPTPPDAIPDVTVLLIMSGNKDRAIARMRQSVERPDDLNSNVCVVWRSDLELLLEQIK